MKYVDRFRIPFSYLNVGEELSVIGTAQIIENNVCAFFASFGKDNGTLSKKYGSIWVFVKNKFRKYSKAAWNEEIVAESYFTEKTAATVVVDTVAKNSDGKTVFAARTEACVIDLATQRIRRVSSVDFPEDIEIYDSVAGFEFTRFEKSALTEKYGFNVPSTSIDVCKHLNNVEYLRFILNNTSVEEELARPVRETELNFVNQAREKECLTVLSGETDGYEIYEIRNGEKVVVRCRISRDGF